MKFITIIFYICLAVVAIMLGSAIAKADARVECPSTNPCKILILTQEEEKILLTQNGILDTAASGRMIDLAQLVNYFRAKIVAAPAGDPQVQKAPSPAPKSPE